jgi:serine phosphatase RsbU (regulator of sigma subunit)/pSer/pThr/pTyr-binding forkhead associated (FHA) protein
MAELQVVKGYNQGATVDLASDKVVLGRNADCNVVINLPAVSREHAVISRVQGKFFIEDLKSRNGTFVNNKEVRGRIPLNHQDQIKICDNLYTFLETKPKPPLPPSMRRDTPEVEEEEGSSTVEATLATSSKQILETQPAEKLAFLLEVSGELTQTFNVEQLLPKIVDRVFTVFKQADRGFIILSEDQGEKLIPKVIKTRRASDEGSARFSRKIVNRCLETSQALLSEDASSDKRFDLSQSIADCRIRSVMCAPLIGRTIPTPLGVIQLDTQDRHKKFTPDDLKLLMAVASQAAVAVESAKMHQDLIARAGIDRDLQIAHKVQLSFLPKRPPELPGYEFAAHYQAALEVGGDYYDFIPLPGPRVAVMLGDVAGKGVSAALLMAKISSDARFSMLTEAGPAEAVIRLNALMQEAGMLDRFVTLAACVLDPSRHEVAIVNAGHLPPLVFRKETGRVEEGQEREMGGLPLGVAEDHPYQAQTITLEPGDFVLLFTDGVTEAKNRQDKQFQLEGVLNLFRQDPCTPRAIADRLVSAVKQHALGCKQHDDITIAAFGREG